MQLQHIRLTLYAIILTLLGTMAQAKGLKDTARIDQVSDHFMSQIVAGKTGDAYALMSAYVGVNLEAFNERGEQVKTSMKKLSESVGQPLSYALVKRQNVEEHFYKLTYLLKYQTAALIWELNYYQPDTGWYLVDVNFNVDINKLFD